MFGFVVNKYLDLTEILGFNYWYEKNTNRIWYAP